MKVCPQCSANYEDSMFFCLEDGNPLKSSDGSFQSNPATFEKTLAIPTDEKTLNLPNNLSGEKTLDLPSESPTEQKSVTTESWQPVPTTPPSSTNRNEEKPVLSGYTESSQNGGGKFVLGATLGGMVLLGTVFGGWWFLQRPSNEVAVANTNQQTQNLNSNLGLSNVNLSGTFGDNNSNGYNANVLINTNKSTPKPTASLSPTKDKKDSPTPTPNQTPEPTPALQPTPTPKTPTPTPAPTRTPPKIVNGGVLNGKAINLVRPPYPPAAKAVRASGAVSVQVLIDEEGNVARASAVSGHALLRAAAESAARASKFSPTMLSGQPVKVTGVIVYNFTAQ